MQVEYQAKVAAYKNQLSDVHLSTLALENLILKEEEKLRREKKIRITNLKVLGMPKRPVPPFIIFNQDLRQKTSNKLSLKEIAEKWKTLNESERKIYIDRANENSERYRYGTQAHTFDDRKVWCGRCSKL